MSRPLVGLYVHIPFCSVKCFYCDFAAFSGQGRTVGRYLAALEAEAGLRPVPAPDTLYVGGGTPSELCEKQIRALFAALRRAYPGGWPKEATFEANPESLRAEKVRVLREEGVTRLSIGLQTLDDRLLKAIGRRHTARDFVERFGEARREGLALSVDLMYGLPGQSLGQCLESLDGVLRLEPEHVSLYGLQVEDRTLFGRRGVEPDEELGRRMYEESLSRLAAAGFRHYELSNFALPGHESAHNQIYWRDGEYIGLGCGAASHLGGVRSANLDRLSPYIEAVEAGRPPVAESERLTGLEKLGETAFLGLRLLEGLAVSPELEAAFAPQWERLTRQGLIERRGALARLTGEGVFLANSVFREFVPPFPEACA